MLYRAENMSVFVERRNFKI